MSQYDFSYGEEAGSGSYKVLRVKDVDRPTQDEADYDIWNVDDDGGFTVRHAGAPAFGQDDSDSTNSGTGVTPTLAAEPTAGSLLVLAVLVDETPGTRTINVPAGFTTFGGNTLFGTMRLNTYLKISDGTEDAAAVTISGGSSEIAAIYTELLNFNSYTFKDIANTDTGTDASADGVINTALGEMIYAYMGFVGSRLTTHSSPTNGYTQQENVATTSMRLSSYTKFVADASDPDLTVTLGGAVNWMVRLCTMSPVRKLIGTSGGSEHVHINTLLIPFQEDVPATPPTGTALIYLREKTGDSSKHEVVVMWETGTIEVIKAET